MKRTLTMLLLATVLMGVAVIGEAQSVAGGNRTLASTASGRLSLPMYQRYRRYPRVYYRPRYRGGYYRPRRRVYYRRPYYRRRYYRRRRY